MIAAVDVPTVPLQRLGGDLCLDFLNTCEYRFSAQPLELIPDYAHLLGWMVHVALVTPSDAAELLRLGLAHPPQMAAAYATAIALRETIHRLLQAQLLGVAQDRLDVGSFNRSLHDYLLKRQLVPGETHWNWSWNAAADDLVPFLGPLIVAAADLMSGPRLAQVRRCPNCAWLFLDTSRNHRRRWCSMEICGNKVKSRRQYARRVGAA